VHLSTVDIAVFPVSRGAALVGPRAAFGLRRVGDMLRTYQEVRSIFDRLTIRETSQLLLRSYFRRWGLEPELRIGRDHAAMAKWLTDQTVRGRLGVLPVPDSALAFAGRSQSQKLAIAHAEAAADYEADDEEPLPHPVEARFVGVLFLVPQHMNGAIRVEYDDIVRKLGRAKISGRLLAWIGPSYMQGSDLSVLAALCRTLTAELIEAMDDLVEAIDETAHAVNAQDLGRIAPKVARAFSPMIEHSVFERLLEPREILGSQGRRKAGDGGKPDLAKKAPRAVAYGPVAKPVQKKTEEKKKPPAKDANGGQSGGGSGSSTPPASPVASRTGSAGGSPEKGGFLPKKVDETEPGAVPMTKALKTEIDGADPVKNGPGMAQPGWPGLKPSDHANFLGDPVAKDLAPGTKIYRIIGEPGKANGGYWSLEPPPQDEGSWRAGSAVQNNWNGDGMYVEHEVGKDGLKGWAGPARAQMSSDGQSALPGGAEQFFIPPGSLDPKTIAAPKPTPWNS
jgi:hypothetical protein